MRKDLKALGSSGTVGLEIVLALLLGILGGRWLDGKFEMSPIFTIIGSVLGVGAAFKALWRSWREMQRITAREEREEGNPTPMFAKPEDDRKDEKDKDLDDAERRLRDEIDAISRDDGAPPASPRRPS